MISLFLTAFLVGIVLTEYFKIFAIIPAWLLLVTISVVLRSSLNVSGSDLILLAIVLVIAMQIGYSTMGAVRAWAYHDYRD